MGLLFSDWKDGSPVGVNRSFFFSRAAHILPRDFMSILKKDIHFLEHEPSALVEDPSLEHLRGGGCFLHLIIHNKYFKGLTRDAPIFQTRRVSFFRCISFVPETTCASVTPTPLEASYYPPAPCRSTTSVSLLLVYFRSRTRCCSPYLEKL